MTSILKKIFHQIRVWLMLKKKISKFGNSIQNIKGEKYLKLKQKSIPKISIIILNHNNKIVIQKCINSLIKYNIYNYEIIIVDNQSTDESVTFLKKKYGSNIKIFLNSINGCSSGRNLGVKKSTGEYLLFLDSDQGPTSNNWLDNYINIASNYPKISAIGWTGGFVTESDMTGPTLDCYPQKGLPSNYLFRTNIDYLGSGGLFISKTFFNKIEGFDINYDPYSFEDTDISRKIIRNNGIIAYTNRLFIYHNSHSTTKSSGNNQEYLKQLKKNAIFFKNKWQVK